MAEAVSRDEKIWSSRAVPKSSRIVCRGLLKTSAIPQAFGGRVVGGVQTPGKSGSAAEGVGHRLSSGWTLGTAAARAVRSGTKAAGGWRTGERRGGKECRSRGSPDHLKKKNRRDRR